jgi:hypothetical protein
VGANGVNFSITNGTATTKNFGTGLGDRTGVSVYLGHSNTTDSLLLTSSKDNEAAFVPFSSFSNHNSITCIAACNSTAVLKNVTLGPGQALIGVTSNLKAGFVKAGDLAYIGTQVVAGLKAGLTTGQIVDGLNKFYVDRAKKDLSYKVRVTLRGDRDATAQ